MKIVQIVNQMEAAGVQKVACRLHEGFCRKGHDSELWFLYKKRPTFVGLPGVSCILDHCPSRKEKVAIVRELFGKLHWQRPDALITHTPYASVLEQTMAAAIGIPMRVVVHHNPHSTYPWPARLADIILSNAGVCTHVVAVSDAVKNSLPHRLRRVGRVAHLIRNGLELSREVDGSKMRDKLHIRSDRRILLTVGRLSRQKNHYTLFQAMRKIPEATLVVAGDGELASQSRRQVLDLGLADRVEFTGEVKQQDVLALMNCADLFVFPSLWEGLPMAALEAMNCGMATVASDIPANREAFGEAAIFVPATDASALALAINTVLRDATLAARLRSNALARAPLFSVENMINQYDRLLQGGNLRQSETCKFEVSENPATVEAHTANAVK